MFALFIAYMCVLYYSCKEADRGIIDQYRYEWVNVSSGTSSPRVVLDKGL